MREWGSNAGIIFLSPLSSNTKLSEYVSGQGRGYKSTESKTLTEKFDGLLSIKKDCWHAAQLQQSDQSEQTANLDQKSPVFCLFWAFQNVLLKMHSTEKPSQPLILYLPALPLCPPPPPSLFDIISYGKLLIVMENWSIQIEIQDHQQLCRSAWESSRGQCQWDLWG